MNKPFNAKRLFLLWSMVGVRYQRWGSFNNLQKIQVDEFGGDNPSITKSEKKVTIKGEQMREWEMS